MIYWQGIVKVFFWTLAFGLFAGWIAQRINKANELKNEMKKLKEQKK